MCWLPLDYRGSFRPDVVRSPHLIDGGYGYGSRGLRGPRTWGVRVVSDEDTDRFLNTRLDEVLPVGMKRAELILRYTLSHPHRHTTIVGTCNPEHPAENLAAATRGPLPRELYEEIRSRIAALPPA